MTKSGGRIQIYAKVYGASKYESTLLAYATSRLTSRTIDLFNICERDLQRLPKSSVATLSRLNINFHDTPLFFDIRHQHDTQAEELRSSAYVYNLLNRLGNKKCALCGCPVQEIVQGAHVWNVADIKKSALGNKEKFKAATSGDNGLWLCQNHHKLFDNNLIMISRDGMVRLSAHLDDNDAAFIKAHTPVLRLSKHVMSSEFLQYLDLRNSLVDLQHSIVLS